MSEAHRYDKNVFDVEEHADGVIVKVPALGSVHHASTLEDALRAAAEELSALQETPEGRRRMRESGLVAAYARSVAAKRDSLVTSGERTDGPAITQLSQSEFDAWIAGTDAPALIDFWAPWCVPCRQMSKAVEQIAREYVNRLRCASVDIDEAPSVAERCEVYSVPTLIAYVDGQETMRMIGAASRRQIVAELADKLGFQPDP